jgi:predicted amidophosphoribosyltransferase
MQKSMNRYACCSSCLEHIAKINTNAARLWCDLCALPQTPILVHGQDMPELRILEQLGYVVSTESAENLSIRLEGRHNFSEDLPTFYCINRLNHDD